MTSTTKPVIRDMSSHQQSNEWNPFVSSSRVSSASSGTQLSNPYVAKEEELNRESTWTPLNIIRTLRGFNPEDELEHAWTPDDSVEVNTDVSEGDTVASDRFSVASDGFSIGTCSSGSVGWRNGTSSSALYEEIELEIRPDLKHSPSKLIAARKCAEHMNTTSAPDDSTEAQEVAGDETREYGISYKNDEVEVRDIGIDELITSHGNTDEANTGFRASTESPFVGGCVRESEITYERDTIEVRDAGIDKVFTSERNEDESNAVCRFLNEPCPSSDELEKPDLQPASSSHEKEHEASVEVSLIEKTKSPKRIRMKRLKSIFGR
jgi:hypothetical protein